MCGGLDSVSKCTHPIRFLNSYQATFFAIGSTSLNLVFSEEVAKEIVLLFAGFLFDDGFSSFVVDRYIPTLRQALVAKGVELSHKAKCRVLSVFLGIMVRIVSSTSLRFVLWFDVYLSQNIPFEAICFLLARRTHPRCAFD